LVIIFEKTIKMKLTKENVKTGAIFLTVLMVGLGIHQVVVAPRLAKLVNKSK